MTAAEFPFTFCKVDDAYYEVSLFGLVLGCVYRIPEAWSYGRWFIEGDRVERTTSASASGRKRRPLGFATRGGAARRLAVMRSGLIVAQADVVEKLSGLRRARGRREVVRELRELDTERGASNKIHLGGMKKHRSEKRSDSERQTFVFVCEARPSFFGALIGWRAKDQPDFNPGDGNLVAHDVLEHFPGGGASPADEFQALGAAQWVHGELGLWPFVRVVHGVFLRNRGGQPLAHPPHTRPVVGPIEQQIQKIEKTAAMVGLPPEYARDAANWMRIGYRRARRRYRGIEQNTVRALFNTIASKVNGALYTAQVGDEMHLTIQPEGKYVDVRVTRHGRPVEEEEEGALAFFLMTKPN